MVSFQARRSSSIEIDLIGNNDSCEDVLNAGSESQGQANQSLSLRRQSTSASIATHGKGLNRKQRREIKKKISGKLFIQYYKQGRVVPPARPKF